MVLGKLKTPSLNVGRFSNFVTSDTVLVVVGAVVVTPILFGILSTFAISRVPILANNIALALLVASVIMFIIATIFSGKLRLIFIGASAGALIQAITQTQIARNVLDKLAQSVPGAT